MKTPFILVAFCCALLSACQMVVAPTEPAEPVHRLDEPIALPTGETARLVDPDGENPIEVIFIGVEADTRCPNSTTSDVMCTWSGAVEVEIKATVDDQIETFILAGTTDYDGYVEGSVESETDTATWYFGGYDFVLVQVIPYPGDERPNSEDYRATVVVRRATGPAPAPTQTPESIDALIDEDGMPLLCVSEKAIVEWAAGALDGEPYKLTPPLVDGSILTKQAADNICAALFGEGWRIGTTGDLTSIWSEVIMTDTVYLVWDDN